MKNMAFLRGFAWAWLALAGRKAIPWLLARFRTFERPEQAPRSPAETATYTVCTGRLPAQEREKRPAAGREKFCTPEKKKSISSSRIQKINN